MAKGLLVSVLRNGYGDCTANGVTKHCNDFVLVGEGVPEIFEANERTPALYLIPGRGNRQFVATPDGRYNMFGGSFIYSCDSRFSAISGQPIHVHDRIER